MAVVINEVCGNENSLPKNIGGKKQCLEGPVKTFALAKEDFSFPSSTDFKDKTKWDTAIAAKDIVPFIYVEGIEANNTEESVKNGRYTDYTLKKAVRGSSYRQDLAICTYEAVKSYEDSEYTRIFRITGEQEVTAEVQDDGAIKGEALSGPIRVGIRNEATDSEPPFANIFLKFKNDVFSILKPGFEVSELEGIKDVTLTQVSASATSIKFKVNGSCSNESINSLGADDFEVRDGDGALVTVSFVSPVDGVYELTGTGFATGYTVNLVGVVSQTEDLYESTGALSINVT